MIKLLLAAFVLATAGAIAHPTNVPSNKTDAPVFQVYPNEDANKSASDFTYDNKHDGE